MLKLLQLMMSMRDAKGNLGKDWWRSKTLWVNSLAIVYFALEHFKVVPEPIPVEVQGAILGIANYILRLVTHQAVGFLDPGPNPGGEAKVE